MTSFLFDYYNHFEVPNIALANPDGSLLYNLGTIYDRNVKLRYNALSEFSFLAPQYTDGILNDYYELLDYRRIVKIDTIGNFMIVGMEIDNDGTTPIKKITCQSIETELNFKKLSLFKGTFKFWDLLDPNPTLLGQMLLYLPGWTIGTISPELLSLYRTFDISDTTIYSFLMNDVSQTFQCIFSFDSINKTISAYSTTMATHNTDIFLSYDNLVESTNIKEITDELVTALNVYGGGDLDIRTVNPLGTDTVYNFDYYMTTDWMSQGLIDALNLWKNKIVTNQAPYANLLTQIKAQNQTLLDQQAALALLHTAPYPDGLDSLIEVQTVRIREGNIDLTVINGQINTKRNQIAAQEVLIAATNTSIYYLNIQLQAINYDLSWSANFTQAQQLELATFIIGSTYTNENFIKTDISTLVEIQDYSQELYNQAVQVLAKISQPRYNFEVNAVNFVFLKEFQTFIDQLVMGAVVTIEFEDGRFTYPALLGIDYSYDNPTDFKLTFSNRLRLDDSAFQFSDLFNQSINSGITTTFNSEQWSNWQTYHKNDVTSFIESALDASKNAVINATNQEIVIDAHGLKGRYLDPTTNQYDPRQVWLINNMMVFTNDNWDHAALALGQITNPTGGSSYGLVADVIVGRLVASNELIVENDNNSFFLDGSGARLYNASFTLQDNRNQIILDPAKGIEISKRVAGGDYTDKQFYIDTDGNVVFAGDLSAASGTFSGTIEAKSGHIGAWRIDNWGLVDDINGNYIYGNGNARIGMLTIEGSEATFDGNIYARNLQDQIYANQIATINADTIVAGTITGIRIFGCEIDWPGVRMYSPVPGSSFIQASNQISLNSGNSFVNLGPTYVSVGGGNITIGTLTDL